MKENLITINVITEKDGHISIQNAYPLLFYWDGTNSISDAIKSDAVFKDWLDCKGIISTVDKYTNTFVNIVKYSGESDKYETEQIAMRKLFSPTECPNVAKNIIEHALEEAYFKAFNIKIDWGVISIKTVYENIINKYNGRITDLSFKNYIWAYCQNNCNNVFPIDYRNFLLNILDTELK